MTDKARQAYKTRKENTIKKYIGVKYGKLTIISYVREGKDHHKYFICKCECGVEKEISLSHLQSKKIRSCGCLWEENKHEYRKTHGGRYDPLYAVWCGMKARCNNKNSQAYKNYGGRGISICKKWDNEFETFKTWAYRNGYAKGLQIDRKNNDGGYTPENCRFVTSKENSRNKRANVYLEYHNERETIACWAEKLGMGVGTLRARLNKLGWDVERALTTPVLKAAKGEK